MNRKRRKEEKDFRMCGFEWLYEINRVGGSLLFRDLSQSIISVCGFNGPVRDGKGWKSAYLAANPIYTVSYMYSCIYEFHTFFIFQFKII